MKKNDALDIRKAAVQAVVLLLDPEDEIALVEFGAEGRVIGEENGSVWWRVKERASILSLISGVGNDKKYTDFFLGLTEALSIFEKSAPGTRKVILLLSDGIPEPNPERDKYTEGYALYQNMLKSGTVSKEEARRLYLQGIRPTVRAEILDQIIPEMKTRDIEIFTVALSPDADRAFLAELSDKTSRHMTEVHSFYAGKATDLIKTFAELIQYWTDKQVLFSQGGMIIPGSMQNLFLDEFISTPHEFTLIDGRGDFIIVTDNGMREDGEPGLHPQLRSYPLVKGTIPGEWSFGFAEGSGNYQTIWIGKSLLKLDISGLKSQYQFGDEVNATAELRFGERNAISYLYPEPVIKVEITAANGTIDGIHEIHAQGEKFIFRDNAISSGSYTIKFTALAKDLKGREILPRPSRIYQFEVLPRFYITPRELNFGKAKTSESMIQEIQIHCGLDNDVTVNVLGGPAKPGFGDTLSKRFPFIRPLSSPLGRGELKKLNITLQVPSDVPSGDQEGIVMFYASDGSTYKCKYRVHILSFWEIYGRYIMALLALAGLALAYLVYIWGILGTPCGVLSPEQLPPGALLSPIELSRVRRGIFSRWFNFHRNLLTIRGRGGDINLPELPLGFRGELSFYRPGRAYICNLSPLGTEHSICVEEVDGYSYELGPGKRLGLRHGSIAKMGDYKFKYENI